MSALQHHKRYLLPAKVMHKRLHPKVNQFVYGVYYLCFPLSDMKALKKLPWLNVNGPSLLSFYEKDHCLRGRNKDEEGQAANVEQDIRTLLAQYNMAEADGEIEVLALPRVFGYVFNPITFWFCCDHAGQLRAVVCEVNNTFGETHLYLCAHPDRRPIGGNDILEHDKIFHVSPYMPREGRYAFRFVYGGETIGAWIDYYGADGQKMLLTSVTGKRQPLTTCNILMNFLRYPLVTLKVIGLIHYQALKLFIKRIRYIYKPEQKDQRISPGNGRGH